MLTSHHMTSDLWYLIQSSSGFFLRNMVLLFVVVDVVFDVTVIANQISYL
jgi:hypothetical protein